MSKARQDTRTILRAAAWLLAAGCAGAIILLLNGSMGHHGPHNGMGWFGLMLALCTIPLGLFALLLGLGKLREDHRRP